MHNEHWKTGHQHLFQFFEYKGQNPEKPPKLSLVRYTDGNTKFSKNTLKYKGVEVWNSLPSDIKRLPSVKSFSRQMKTFVVN